MNVFLDTNIYLSFYDLSSRDIDALKGLLGLVSLGTFTLIITEQTKNEIDRNRDEVVRRIIDEFDRHNKNPFQVRQAPFMKDYEELASFNNSLKEVSKAYNSLSERLRRDVASRSLETDRLINGLCEKSKLLTLSDDVYNAALKRKYRGNPPGKSPTTIGDEVNWELLLKYISPGEELFLVSNDKDYINPIDKGRINYFLDEEWQRLKGSKIVFYSDLSEFLKVAAPQIQLRDEQQRQKLISELAASGNFQTTHEIIAKLASFSRFSLSQARTLFSILQNNTQVKWIATDSDILDFFSDVLQDVEDQLEMEEKMAVRSILEGP